MITPKPHPALGLSGAVPNPKRSCCFLLWVFCSKVYTNKNHLLDEAHGGASDDEDGRGPKMVYFDLKV